MPKPEMDLPCVMHFLRYSALTDIGLQRSNNEDCYLCDPSQGLWLVADGMGGHAAGEVASDIVRRSVRNAVRQGVSLSRALQYAHQQVLNAAQKGIGGEGMGSTAVAMLSRGSHYELAWVGDSRGYLWDLSASQPLEQLTRDHSYVQMLYDTGAIREEEVADHPEKNIITQCLGSQDLDAVTVDTHQSDWRPGQLILLCSDGLTDVVSDEEISDLLAAPGSLRNKTRNLIQQSLSNGGRDNITAVLVQAPNKLQKWVSEAGRRLASLRSGAAE